MPHYSYRGICCGDLDAGRCIEPRPSRVERNYLAALGRTAEADGESAIYADLRQRLWTDPADLQTRYRRSPLWLRKLMDAWAGGLNYYLRTHPAVHPSVLAAEQVLQPSPRRVPSSI